MDGEGAVWFYSDPRTSLTRNLKLVFHIFRASIMSLVLPITVISFDVTLSPAESLLSIGTWRYVKNPSWSNLGINAWWVYPFSMIITLGQTSNPSLVWKKVDIFKRFLAVSDIYPMFIEPTITWVSSGFSGYIWLDTKILFKKKMMMMTMMNHLFWKCPLLPH